MSDYAVVISCLLNSQDKVKTELILDTVESVNVNSSSSVVSFPVLSRDVVSDHFYNNNDTLSLSGTFSLNGKKGIVIDKAGGRLDNIQDIFEKIKREGILCDIVKVHLVSTSSGEKEPKFKVHTNMILKSISWTENINTLDFSFSFQEVLTARIEEPKKVDLEDAFLPNIEVPNTLSFTDTVIDVNQLLQIIIQTLQEYDLAELGFLQFVASLKQTVGAVILTAIAVILASNVIGWAIGVAIIIAVGLYTLFSNLVKRDKHVIEKFRYYEDAIKRSKEVTRFEEFNNEMIKQFEVFNNYIKVFSISANEAQENILTIDDAYYIFTFTKNNINQQYSLVIKDMNENIVGSSVDVSSALTNINQCTEQNNLFKNVANSKTFVYLLKNPNEEDETNLSNYYVVTSTINIEKDYTNAIVKIIKESLYIN